MGVFVKCANKRPHRLCTLNFIPIFFSVCFVFHYFCVIYSRRLSHWVNSSLNLATFYELIRYLKRQWKELNSYSFICLGHCLRIIGIYKRNHSKRRQNNKVREKKSTILATVSSEQSAVAKLSTITKTTTIFRLISNSKNRTMLFSCSMLCDWNGQS